MKKKQQKKSGENLSQFKASNKTQLENFLCCSLSWLNSERERADKALEQWLVSNFVVCNKWTWHTRIRQASAVIYVLQEILSLCNSMLSDESESESCGTCSCIIYSYDPPASKARSKKNPRSLHFIDLLDESSRHHHRPHVFCFTFLLRN